MHRDRPPFLALLGLLPALLGSACVDLNVPGACARDQAACAPKDTSSPEDTLKPDSTISEDGDLDARGETEDGDTNDSSLADVCEPDACRLPPDPTCVGASTRRTYAATGTCGDGGCSYLPTDTPCPSNVPFCMGGTCTNPPSCAAGLVCNGESCCTSIPVPGGNFSRSYDGVTTGYTDPQFKATVSDFRLDKYEVTVARFRSFVSAVTSGWRPAPGAGKHTHLAGGGLNSGTEAGWETTWNPYLAADKGSWDSASYLACNSLYATWTPSPGTNEGRPINCVDWYQAYAFCIWDGGFLPTEAEWNYAAAGGSDQRKYPWGPTVPGANATLAIYGCYYNGTGTCASLTNIAPVGTASVGNAKWGHADLAGNVWEWVLDRQANPYNETACNDCAFLLSGVNRIGRGGGFADGAGFVLTGYRGAGSPAARNLGNGIRCARTP